MVLEVSPNRLLRLTRHANLGKFQSALNSNNANLTAGILVSFVVESGGVERAPLALLASHVTTHLMSLQATEENREGTGK